MLAIQEYIHANGLEALTDNLGIRVYEHPTLPLVGCKYSQIDSPRTHPVVRNARGIVLERNTWAVVAKPFDRFYNVGEVADEYAQFNWNDFTCVEKVDGSLIILYHYDGEWHVNTSGSFGLGQAPNYNGTWRDLFWRFAGINRSRLYPYATYILELCTPWNKVVKTYKTPTVYLLGVNDNSDEHSVDLPEYAVNAMADWIGVKRPKTYKVDGCEEVKELIFQLNNSDDVDEGIIIRDRNNMRFKWKTEKYVALHHLKDNGNVIMPKRLTAICLTGEVYEMLAVMPEITTALECVDKAIDEAMNDVVATWEANKGAKTQKEFALAVKDHKFAWALFQMRKGAFEFPTLFKSHVYLRKLFIENNNKVAQTLFGDTTFTFDVDIEDATNTG